MLYVDIAEKTMGSKLLLRDFSVRIADGEKAGFLGRNGTGKTTLFNVITGKDTDFDGVVEITKGLDVLATSQEHHHMSGTTLEYISSKLPRFAELSHIIATYPEHMGDSNYKMGVYADAIEEFSRLGYYEIENSLQSLFDAYQLEHQLLNQPFSSLSGGQKRLAELISIQLAEPHIALLDEPTNHMDYVAKAAFIDWLKKTKSSVVVISHDRDVLKNVERVVELKDMKAFSYPGNYDAYLAQNAIKTANAIHDFQTREKHIVNLREQIVFADVKARSSAGGKTGKSGKNSWVVMRERLQKSLDELLDNHEKPSFWIDRESAEALNPRVGNSYDKFKAKNIKLHKNDDEQTLSTLLSVENLSLGYDNKPLFQHLDLSIAGGERLHVIGRNGAGKTTLVRAIIAASEGKKPETLIGRGVINCDKSLRISLYEQEMSAGMLDMTLYEAIEHIYLTKNVKIGTTQILRDMSNYLFDPQTDRDILVNNLSGGQKARLQLIRLLIGSPNLLILDEPTNHLDLPSIEELENALRAYTGAIIYISHDSYFARNIGGKDIIVGS